MLPYSIGHEIILTREASPFVASEWTGASRDDVALAAFVCCQTFQDLTDSNSLYDAVKALVWRFRARKMNEETEALKFMAYRKESFKLPENKNAPPPEGATVRMTGTPLIFQLLRFVMSMGYSEADALNYPLALARWHWLAKGEQDGLIYVESEYDAHIKRLQKGESPCRA